MLYKFMSPKLKFWNYYKNILQSLNIHFFHDNDYAALGRRALVENSFEQTLPGGVDLSKVGSSRTTFFSSATGESTMPPVGEETIVITMTPN